MGCSSSKQVEEVDSLRTPPATRISGSIRPTIEAGQIAAPNVLYEESSAPRPAALPVKLSGEPSGLDLKEATEKPMIVFVIGGPGSGKGTQCSKMVEKYGGGFRHLSMGDLLRAEVARGSSLGQNLKAVMKSGALVSDDQVIKLLENEINESAWFGLAFLVDGFPRTVSQAQKFESRIRPCDMVLFFDCPETVLTQRLLDRGKSSGRRDDNPTAVKERLKTFKKQTMPVVDYYKQEQKLYSISAAPPVDQIFKDVSSILDERLGKNPEIQPEAKAEASAWRMAEVIDIENRFYGSLKD